MNLNTDFIYICIHTALDILLECPIRFLNKLELGTFFAILVMVVSWSTVIYIFLVLYNLYQWLALLEVYSYGRVHFEEKHHRVLSVRKKLEGLLHR